MKTIKLTIKGEDMVLEVGGVVEVEWDDEPYWSAEQNICKTVGYIVEVEMKKEWLYFGERERTSSRLVFARENLGKGWGKCIKIDVLQITNIRELK